MDSRSTATLSDPAGAFERFAASHGPAAEHLRRARVYTAERLVEARAQLRRHEQPTDASVVLFGSWARHELTKEAMTTGRCS